MSHPHSLQPVPAGSVDELLARELARGTSDLPALSRTATDAMRLARSPDFTLEAAAKLAERDASLTARLIAVANSPLYSRGAPVMTPARAVQRIGGQTTRDVLFQIAYASMLGQEKSFGAMVSEVFTHGLVVARLAALLAAEYRVDREAAYLGGLLHDVGRARCWRIVTRLTKARTDDPEVHAAIDHWHARAGGSLAEAWKLPLEVAECCAEHHESHATGLTAVVQAADLLEHGARDGEGSERAVKAAAALEALRLGPYERWVPIAKAERENCVAG